jgi:adenylate kinase
MYPLFEHNTEKAEYWVLDRGGNIGDLPADEYQRLQDKAKELARRGEAEILVDKHGLLIVHRLPRADKANPAP